MRVSRPVPRRALVAASACLACVALPATARAAPDAVATPTVAGPPALVAWSSGRDVLVAGPDGAGRRVVARLRSERDLDSLTLSADGRRLALVTSRFESLSTASDLIRAVRVADLTAGGPLRTLARNSSHEIVSWSPDGQRALLVGDTIRLCDVAAQTPCRGVARNVRGRYGATWAPDGLRFAYVRAQAGRRPQGPAPEASNLVVGDGTGRERTVERERRSGRRGTLTVNPVWTARGLAWTTLSVAFAEDLQDARFTRSSTRLLGADGRRRTVAALPVSRRTILPFVLASDSPSGEPIGVRSVYRGTAEDSLVDELVRVTPSGTISPWGLTLANDVLIDGGVRDEYLGTLADGRAAVARTVAERRSPSRIDEPRTPADWNVTVHLVGPNGSLGPVLASAFGAIAVATPYPAAP
ncbi:TolB family protein [Patulibacter americanus]|uniref:TolB family protein n=1 Tax=Patulibacter americanus TaxID=588672 RepID=UPI0003B5CF04|nr:hypothetical protein [Patulibacter americanus]